MLYHDGLRTTAAENARHSSIIRAPPSDHPCYDMHRIYADYCSPQINSVHFVSLATMLLVSVLRLCTLEFVLCGVDETSQKLSTRSCC